MKPLVYVAGPITSDPVTHTREAVERYIQMIQEDKVIPFCPHLSVLAEYCVGRSDYEMWLAHDFDMVERADAVLRTPGESSGADREVAFADKLRRPVFYSTAELYAWVDRERSDMHKLDVAFPVRRVVPNEFDGGF